MDVVAGQSGTGFGCIGQLFDADGNRLRLPDAWATSVNGAVGQEITLGIRPQALETNTDGAGPRLAIEVDHTEILGETVDLVGYTRARQRVIARMPVRAGADHAGATSLAVDLVGAYPFERGPFGANLLHAL